MMLRLIKYADLLEESSASPSRRAPRTRLETRADALEIEAPGPSYALEDAVHGVRLELRPPDLPGRPGQDLVDVQKPRCDEPSQRRIAHPALVSSRSDSPPIRSSRTA
jgi:hypothetical protein